MIYAIDQPRTSNKCVFFCVAPGESTHLLNHFGRLLSFLTVAFTRFSTVELLEHVMLTHFFSISGDPR